MNKYPHGFPCNCTSIKEANEYGLYEYDEAALRAEPLGTTCAGDNVFTQEPVLEFLRQFSTGQFFLAFAPEGEIWDQKAQEEYGEKAVQTFYFKYKDKPFIPVSFLHKMKHNPYFYDDNISLFNDHEEDPKDYKTTSRLLNNYFEYIITQADGALTWQGGDYNEWLMFDSE